jgi:hypothetical protein
VVSKGLRGPLQPHVWLHIRRAIAPALLGLMHKGLGPLFKSLHVG